MKHTLPVFLRSLLLSGLFLIGGLSTYANHIRGMDLSYTWVSGNTYKVTVTAYGDCAVTTPSLVTARPVICTYNGGTFFRSDTLTIEAPSTGTDVSQVCAAYVDSTTCRFGTIPGTKKYVYSKNITVSGPSHAWRFIFDGNLVGSQAGRAAAITNITPSGTTIIQLVDTLDNTYHNNNSPNLTVIPTPYYCLNNQNNYSPGAIDADGDSLRFNLVAGINNSSFSCSGTTTAGAVTYISGASAGLPIISPTSFLFDQSNGSIAFTTATAQNSLIVYNVREYRNDTFIGTSQREMSFIITTCTLPPPHGIINATTGTGVIVDTTHFEICHNSGPFTFDIAAIEPDLSYNITVTASGVPVGATLTTAFNGTNHPVSTFSWNATTASVGTYTFYLTFKDNACPISGSNTVAYTVTIDPLPGAITGTMVLCQGLTTTLNCTPAGGSWVSDNVAVATVDPSTGVVTGVSGGTANITYSYGLAGCTSVTTVTVNPSPAAITGTTTICIGATTTLSDVTTPGQWTSSNPAIATVGLTTGLVTGISAGTVNITYTLTTTGCYIITPVVVNSLPGPILGTLSVCAGATTNLSNSVPGGTWTSGTPAVATIGSSSGTVTGVSPGTSIITYSLGSGCTVTAVVTVNTAPAPINPLGAVSVCVGSNTTLTDATPGGAWTTGNPAIATVAGGVVTGVGVGVVNISYTIGTCSAVKSVTVVSTPAPILPGSSTVCTGANITLTDATPGGTWSSNNVAVATVAGGVVTGVSAGTATISYALGTCFVIATVTVNTSPSAITPGTPVSVCVGATTNLADPTPGGAWTSGNVGIATVGSTGIVTGVSVGVVTISYTIAGCSATKQVTVLATPSAITPSSSTVCLGSTSTLTNSSPGGTWTSSDPSIATIGSSSGLVTGVAIGSVTITYTIGTCFAIGTVTVNPVPLAITPATPVTICVGGTTTLADATLGGVWSSGNTAIATVGSTGIVTGVGVGPVTISYTVAGCAATKIITVNTAPSAIAPLSSNVCIGFTETLTDGVPGGTWTSSNPAIATIGSSSGLVTGVALGNVIITYSIGTCTTTATVTVNTAPNAGTIVGPSNVCVGSAITLSDAAPGGTWSSSNTAIAVVSVGGLVTGTGAGVVTISYSVTNTCGTAVATHTVNVVPSGVLPIVGASLLCAGTFTTYTDGTVGGTWSVTNANATINPVTGLLTGITPGLDTVKYTVTNVCGTSTTTKPITIGAYLTAGTISGPSVVCVGSTIVVTDPAPGGVWSTSIGNASVVGGTVTGATAGIDTVKYTVTSGCGSATATHPVTVNPLPDAGTIVGPAAVCVGSVTNYSDASPGGVWNISNSHATIIGTGDVTAVSVGLDTITYSVTNSCGTASTTKVITIGTAVTAGTISGPGNVCIGSTITLTDPTPGGTWSSSNTAIATVAGGVVTGVSNGVVTISYSVTGSCNTDVAIKSVTVSPVAVAGAISGPSSLCIGTFSTYTDPSPGGVWSLTNGFATVTVGGVVTGVAAGTDTLMYTVATGCGTATATNIITISPTVGAGTISGPTAVCVGSTITLTDGTPGGTWSASNTNATVGSSTGVVTGVSNGTVTISYTVTGSCGTAVATYLVTVSSSSTAGVILGPSAVCVAGLITLTDAVPGGAWSSSNSNATITTGGVVTGITPGLDTISYTVMGACGLATATKVIAINTLPVAGTILGPSSVCVGASITLTDASPGGLWTSSNTNATVGSLSGIVTGITAGTSVISYTVSNACGSISTTKTITIDPSPTAGTIVGPDSVCVGNAILLTDATPGGTWSAGNTNATVTIGGVVTGVATGTDPISYTVTTGCGTATAVKIITISTIPTSGVIVGPSSVCVGSGITLSDATPGGTWLASNSHAIIVGPGIVDGVTVGVDTIFYVVTNSCGTSEASQIINVNPVPVVDPITGPTNQCVGTAITLSDLTAGGVWTSSTPAVATIELSTGIATGVSIGVTTITYTVTNIYGCPTSVTAMDTVGGTSGLPAIDGGSNVCVGSTLALSDSVGGGTWSASNGNATVSGLGVVTGVTSGADTIIYTVTTPCGTATVSTVITVSDPPNAGFVSGPGNVCVGSSVTLVDSFGGAGVWSSSNGTATVGSSTGVVTGVAPGVDTISYTVTNACGSAVATRIVNIGLMPTAGTITGSTGVCIGASVTMTESVSGGTWSMSNSRATITSSGIVTGVSGGMDTIIYTVSNSCGTATATRAISVNQAPSAGTITGATSVCPGGTITLSATGGAPGGSWSSSNTAVATVSSSGIVSAHTPGPVTISYTVSNSCGSRSASRAITVLTHSQCNTMVNGVTNISEVKIYPNPATSLLNIDAPATVNVSVLSLDGKVLIHQNAATTIDVSKLADGMYIIMIYDENDLLIKAAKFAKTK
jgi:uncharacterized protein YjdB